MALRGGGRRIRLLGGVRVECRLRASVEEGRSSALGRFIRKFPRIPTPN
jgi:hypothetical protein